MEGDYRMTHRDRIVFPMSLFRGLCLALLFAALAACASGDGTEKGVGRDADAQMPARISVIVNLAVEAPDMDALSAVRKTVMDRLREELSPVEFAEVRTFSRLPAIALSADPTLIATLLSMPEVLSIERDREMSTFKKF